MAKIKVLNQDITVVKIYNPNFKAVEFDGVRKEAGLNSFTLSSKKWIEATNAIGIVTKSGRYGGTYAHKDIAFEFASIDILEKGGNNA